MTSPALRSGEPVIVPLMVICPLRRVAAVRTGAGWGVALVGWAMPPAALL
jgi:hypothetical protein